MPNWCQNTLTVFGPREDIDVFRRKAAGRSPWPSSEPDEQPNLLNFHSLVPIPEKVLCGDYSTAGYDWELKHWGTKWGACHTEVTEEGENRLVYAFETAWGPPIAFLEAVGKQWPKLTFLLDYSEEAMGIKGIAMSRGRKSEDHCIEY